MDKNNVIPFGLLFEETMIPILENVSAVYDESEDINVIIDEDGNKTPYVEWKGNMGTKTETRIRGESMDDDEPPNPLGTHTITEVKIESSDIDDMVNLFLGTKTITAVKAEETDDDPSEMNYSRKILGTKTLTKEHGEGTDDDDE